MASFIRVETFCRTEIFKTLLGRPEWSVYAEHTWSPRLDLQSSPQKMMSSARVAVRLGPALFQTLFPCGVSQERCLSSGGCVYRSGRFCRWQSNCYMQGHEYRLRWWICTEQSKKELRRLPGREGVLFGLGRMNVWIYQWINEWINEMIVWRILI